MAITINGDTGIASVNGSAGSPSVRGTDSNSGIVYAADTVAISTGGTERLEVDSSGNIDIPDNGKIRFGTGNDLQIYHSGSHNVIAGRHASADLYIQTNNDIYLEKVASDGTAGETLAKFIGDGGIEFYENNSKRCQVIGNGFKIEANHHLELPSGNWTGEHSGKIQSHGGGIYFQCGSNSGYWDFRLPNGTNVAGINASGTYSTSDERLKKDITTIPNAVDTIKQLTGRSFTWINGDKKSFGIIAQEVQSVLPDIVDTPPDPANKYPDDPMRSVNYAALTGYFIEAIKELSAEVDALKTKVVALEAHTHE